MEELFKIAAFYLEVYKETDYMVKMAANSSRKVKNETYGESTIIVEE